MIAVKSSVQALDPACGIWLVGKVVKEHRDSFEVRWNNYNVTDRVPKAKVRLPVSKRQCSLRKEDWAKLRPSLYQKGESVTVKKADGSPGEHIIVKENDPFECVMYGANRRLKYEWLMETSTSLPTGSTTTHDPPPATPPQPRRPFAEIGNLESSHPTPVNPPCDEENTTPEPQTRKRRRPSPKSTPQWKKKSTSTLVKKKIATRIAMGEAAPADDGGPQDDVGYANGCGAQAALALQHVVQEEHAIGNAVPVPDEWRQASPSLLCSAVCEGKFSQIEGKFVKAEMKLQQQEEQLKQMMEQIKELRNTIAQLQQPQLNSPAETVGNALRAVCVEPQSPSVTHHTPTTLTSPDTVSTYFSHDRGEMAKSFLKDFFTVNERLTCNTSGKHGKEQLDPQRLASMRQIIFAHSPMPSPQTEDVEWNRLRGVIDLSNRHLRQLLKGKALSA